MPDRDEIYRLKNKNKNITLSSQILKYGKISSAQSDWSFNPSSMTDFVHSSNDKPTVSNEIRVLSIS